MKTVFILIIFLANLNTYVVAKDLLPQDAKSVKAREIMGKVFLNHRNYSKIMYSGDFNYKPTADEQAAWDAYQNILLTSYLMQFGQTFIDIKNKFLKLHNIKKNKLNEINFVVTNSHEISAYYEPETNIILLSLGLLIAANNWGDMSIISIKLLSQYKLKEISSDEYLRIIENFDKYETNLVKTLYNLKDLQNTVGGNLLVKKNYQQRIFSKEQALYVPEFDFPVYPNLESFLKIKLPYQISWEGNLINESDFNELKRNSEIDFMEFFISHELCHALKGDKVSKISSHKQEYLADQCAIASIKSIREDKDYPSFLPLRILLKLPGVDISEKEFKINPNSTHPHPGCRIIDYIYNIDFTSDLIVADALKEIIKKFQTHKHELTSFKKSVCDK